MVQAKSCLATFSVGLGLILVILGVVVKYSLFPTLLQSQIYDNLDLRDGTEAFDAFVSKRRKITIFLMRKRRDTMKSRSK